MASPEFTKDWRDLSYIQREVVAERLFALGEVSKALIERQFSPRSIAVVISWYLDQIAADPTSDKTSRKMEFFMKWCQNNSALLEKMGIQDDMVANVLAMGTKAILDRASDSPDTTKE
ncbi:MAG: hypothetical protein L0Y56_21655 [Nitrospira sp.]|nr:hypothetical protein [Nitrospira sp.]